MANRLFIKGMFRSGTTLFARMCNTHHNIVCASDPFRPFFNALRDDVVRQLEAPASSFDPLEDYFADEDGVNVFEAVQDSTMDRPFPEDIRVDLLNKIVSHAEPFSPKITARLDEIPGETFREVYDALWTHVSAAYGKGGERWEATKEVWTTEFTPVLANEYPESKFVHVVRDPRAVCASKNVQEDSKYPWLFLIRQWRKIAILTHRYSDQFPDRVFVVRYEDLVQSPRSTVTNLCEFLDIELDENMLAPSNFIDGAGEQWLQNTSYDESGASFDTSSVDKWRDILTDRQVEYIEQLTFPEMRQYGYEPEASTYGLTENLVFNPPRVPQEELADWILDYFEDWDRFDHISAVATERSRQELLLAGIEALEYIDKNILKGLFLYPEYGATAAAVMSE